jgi:hypothetical protein
MELHATVAEVSRPPDINLFVLSTGRLPKIGDAVAPWQ